MSFMVIAFQLLILVSICGAALLKGFRGLTFMALFWVFWTAVMVFMQWLVALQFVTIVISVVIALPLAGIRNLSAGSRGFRAIVGCGVLLLGVWLMFFRDVPMATALGIILGVSLIIVGLFAVVSGLRESVRSFGNTVID